MKLLAFFFLAILAAAATLYNSLVRARNRVATAWSDIDVQLQRRHDLIPNLVRAVDQYAAYERSTLAAIAELRAQAQHAADISARGEVELQLASGVQKLLALSENYPDLKASQNFLAVQKELAETENYLQFARRYYNGSVRDYNTRTETFPGNVFASFFAFRSSQFFQKAADDVANVPLVKLGSIE